MNTAITDSKEHVQCVEQAARQVFDMTCGVELEQVCPAASTADGVVLAIISIVGDLDWSIFLGLPRSTAEKATRRFAGFEIPFDSGDMGDAVGELANIFAGQIKALLDAKGVSVEISLPSVVRAAGMEVLIQRGAAAEKFCYRCELGDLWTGIVSGRNPGMVA